MKLLSQSPVPLFCLLTLWEQSRSPRCNVGTEMAQTLARIRNEIF